MTEPHPASSRVHLWAPACFRSTSFCPGGLEPRSPGAAGWTVTCGPGQPLSPGLGLLAPVGLCPSCRPGGRVGAGRWSLPAPLGVWRSDQGVLGLEAGGAARARADASQHGDLRAAGQPVAAAAAGWVLVFAAQAQDAL